MMQKILSYFFEKSLEEENVFLNSCDETNINKEEIKQMIQTQLDQMVDCFTVDQDIVTNHHLQVYLTDGSDNKGIKQIKMSQDLEHYVEIANDAIEKYIDKKLDEEKEMKELHVGQLRELRNMYDTTLSKFPIGTNTTHITQERDDVMREYVTSELSSKLQSIIHIVETDIKSKQELINTLNTEINSFETEIKNMHYQGIIPTDDNQKRKLETYQQYLNAQVNLTNQILQLEEKKQEYVAQIKQLETYPVDNLENLIQSEYLEKNAQKSILINNNLLIQALIPSNQQNSTAIIKLTNTNDLIFNAKDCCKTFKEILKHYIAFYTGLSTIEQFHSYNTAVSGGVRDDNNILNLLSSFSNKNKEIKQTEIDTVLSEFLARSKINCDTQNNTKPLIKAKKTTYNIASNVCIKSIEILDKLNNIENNISDVINGTETLKQTFDTEYANNATPAILDKKNETIKYYYKVLEINNNILKIKAIVNTLLYKTNNMKTRIQNVGSINEIKMNFVRSILSLCGETKDKIDEFKNKITQLKNNNVHNDNKLDTYRNTFNNLIDNIDDSLNTHIITLLNNQISEIDVIIRDGIISTDNNFSTYNLNQNENILDSIKNNLVVIANNNDTNETTMRTRIHQNKYGFIPVNDEILLLQKQKEIMLRISQIGLKRNNLSAVYVLTKYDGLKTQEENKILQTLCEDCGNNLNMLQHSDYKVDLFTPYNIHDYTKQILNDSKTQRNIQILNLQYNNEELKKQIEYDNILKNHTNNSSNNNNNSSTPTIYTGNIYNTNAT